MKNRVLTFLAFALMFSFVIPTASAFALEGEDVPSGDQTVTKSQNMLDAPVAGMVSSDNENVFQPEKPNKKLYTEQPMPNGPVANPGTRQKETSSSSRSSNVSKENTPSPAVTVKTGTATVGATDKTTADNTTSTSSASRTTTNADNSTDNVKTTKVTDPTETQSVEHDSRVRVSAPKAGVITTNSGDARLVFTAFLILAVSVMGGAIAINVRSQFRKQ